jgi:tRNA pseudouridine55 synthase
MNKYEDGELILINKPLGWTSFDVVQKIRNITGVRKVGHAGTLDPLATGLLLICTGRFTKKINQFMAEEKEYIGTMVIGATTPTYDLESEPSNFTDVGFVSEETVILIARKFVGELEQIPPAHSAIKIKGQPVYKLARKGIDVKLEARKIVVKELDITGIRLPEIDFRVVCSTGTYIRSLVNDFGRALGTGAYLCSLCRTKIGNYSIKEAQTLEEFNKSCV